MPLRLREGRQDSFQLGGQRRRRDGLGQKSQARALLSTLLVERLADLGEKLRPRTNLVAIGERLRAVRVVESEQRGLREVVRRATTGGMVRVAFELRGPSLVALRQEPRRDSA